MPLASGFVWCLGCQYLQGLLQQLTGPGIPHRYVTAAALQGYYDVLFTKLLCRFFAGLTQTPMCGRQCQPMVSQHGVCLVLACILVPMGRQLASTQGYVCTFGVLLLLLLLLLLCKIQPGWV